MTVSVPSSPTTDPPDQTDRPAHDDTPVIKSVRASGSWQGSMATAVSIREFSFVSDEPVAVGGSDTAPTPMEIVAGAVNACTTVVIEQVAGELGITLGAIDTETIAHLDVRGFRGTADVPAHFLDYALHILIASDASEAHQRALQRAVEKRSPAISLIRAASVPLEWRWEFRRR
ncbi:MAG: OsmC family peroxiredoxin [Microbacteriaceae bacterium]|nr:MAG: OsmC family peroxiredoxin [Microbacteriaceae bacterium]